MNVSRDAGILSHGIRIKSGLERFECIRKRFSANYYTASVETKPVRGHIKSRLRYGYVKECISVRAGSEELRHVVVFLKERREV